MDFKIDNKYWLKRFIYDFIQSNESFFKRNKISIYDIKTFGNKFIFRNTVEYQDKQLFIDTLKDYESILIDYVLVIKNSELKKSIMRRIYNYLKCKDPHNEFDLKKIRFDLVNITIKTRTSKKEQYLLVCDIDKNINFELIYGTFKVINII